jgi:serine/threonine protein kinase
MVDELTGSTIDRYDLVERLGRGGMGVVYRAHDRALKRIVALKVLAPELLQDSTARARFQREITAAVAIEHPHVVPVYDAGYDEGHFYLVMRYVDGPDLFNISREGPLPEARAMRLVGQIASALFDVHQHGLVHRDVKPENVLVWNAGAPDEHTFLTDFGIAKALNETQRITRVGALGTRGYMAPELVDGAEPTPACDQFSLACLLFQLLTCELPFDPDDLDPLPRSLFLHAPTVSKPVAEAIERALSPNPTDRFPDVKAFVAGNDVAQESFERSQAISETVAGVKSDSELVSRLFTNHGLTDAAIAEITDLERARVMQLRRRAARRSLIGE